MQANWKSVSNEKIKPKDYVQYLVCGIKNELRNRAGLIREAEPFTDCAHFDGMYWKSASHSECQRFNPGEVKYWDEMPKPHRECLV